MFGSKQKSTQKTTNSKNAKKVLVAPTISKDIMNSLREHLLTLNNEGIVGTGSELDVTRSKSMYMALANTVIQQCGVNDTTFNSACSFKPEGEESEAKLEMLFSSMSVLRQVENLVASGKDTDKYKQALDNVFAATSGDGKTRFPKSQRDILERINPATEKEGFFILSMAMVASHIQQVYDANLQNGNIVANSAQGDNNGIYSLKNNIDTLVMVLKDIADGFTTKHPSVGAVEAVQEVQEATEEEKPIAIPEEIVDTPEEIIPAPVVEDISRIRQGCRNYIMTASFAKNATPPEGWLLSPFVESVEQMIIAQNVTFSTTGDTAKKFMAYVNEINSRVKLSFENASKIVEASSQDHGYIANASIKEMITGQILDALSSSADMLHKENDDQTSENGTVTDGNTTKKIRESLANITGDIDEKLSVYLKAAENYLPQLELCHENMKSSPELVTMALDEKVENGDDFYFKAKKLLRQADENIDAIIEIVDENKEVSGDSAYLKWLIEKQGNYLFTNTVSVTKGLIKLNFEKNKKEYKGKSGTKKMMSEKIDAKFQGEDRKYFAYELRRRLSKLAPSSVTDETEDALINMLEENKKRNETYLGNVLYSWIPDLTSEKDKEIYKKEFNELSKKYTPLDKPEFETAIAHLTNMIANMDIISLRGNKADKTPKQNPTEKKEKLSAEEEKKKKFIAINRDEILEKAGDFSENLLYGFTNKSLRINNDRSEAATERDIRIRKNYRVIGKPLMGKKGNKKIKSLIEFSSEGEIGKENFKVIKESYLKYIEAEGCKSLKDKNQYCYYGTEKYRIKIEQLMGDDFGQLKRKDFEAKLADVCIEIGIKNRKKKDLATLKPENAKETDKAQNSEDESIAKLSTTLKERIEDIGQYNDGELLLLTPYLTDYNEIYHTLLGTDDGYFKFYYEELPNIAKRMSGIYNVFAKSRTYFVSMVLKMPLKKYPQQKVADLIIEKANDNDEVIAEVTSYAKELEEQEVGDLTAKEVYEDMIKNASGKKDSTYKETFKTAIADGIFDTVMYSKKRYKGGVADMIKDVEKKSKLILEMDSYKNYIDKIGTTDKKATFADKKVARAKKRAFENLTISFFIDLMVYEDEKTFKDGLEERVTQFLNGQEAAKAEGRFMQSEQAKRREKSKELRDEILEGEAHFQKQKNVAAIVQHVSNRQVSASNQAQLIKRIGDEDNKNMTAGETGKESGQTPKENSLSTTEVRQQKAVVDKSMRETKETITDKFLSKNGNESRKGKVPALKHYIEKNGGNEIVQGVVAEFLVEHDVDPEGKEKERQFSSLGNFEASNAAIDEIKAKRQAMAEGSQEAPINGMEEETAVKEENAVLEQKDNETQESLTLESELEANAKAEKKEREKLETESNDAAKDMPVDTAFVNKAIKSVSEIYTLLTLSFEKIGLSQYYVKWGLSSIIMEYGDRLMEFDGDSLIAAVYNLANKFKEKLDKFARFAKLDNLARTNEDTYAEYNDKVRILSIQLGSMDNEEYVPMCDDLVDKFSLYCNACFLCEEGVYKAAEKYSDSNIDETQKNKARLSLVKIMRGRIEKNKITTVEDLKNAIAEQLDDSMTFNLLTQSGYTVDSVGSDDKKTNENSAYFSNDKMAFEKFLQQHKKPFAYYNSLSQRENAVFFAILANSTLRPRIAQNNSVSSEVISEFETSAVDETESGRVIFNYTNGEEVKYEPRDYTYAIDTFMKCGFFTTDNVRDDVFKSIIKIMDGLRIARRAHKAANSEVLDNNPEVIIKKVLENSENPDEKEEKVDIMEKAKNVNSQESLKAYIEILRADFVKQYRKVGTISSDELLLGKITELQKIIADEKQNRQLMILIGILQKRSVVDSDKRGGGLMSAIIDTYKEAQIMEKCYANAAGRNDVIERFSALDDGAIGELLADDNRWKKAALTLVSYQVSSYNEIEDVNKVTSDDIVGASRITSIDVGLLKGALLLLDSVMENYVRNVALDKISSNVVVEKAKPLYNKYNDEETPIGDSTFEEFIYEQNDQLQKEKANLNVLWTVNGYSLLLPQDKELLMAILSDRTMIDLTKEGIGKERFGLTGDARQQINSAGRIDLMQEYVHRGKVEINNSTRRKAITTLLTSQVNDVKSTEEEIVSSKRTTAVDWKLFNRAIHFVTLCQKARENFVGRRELERALLGGDSPMSYDEEVDLYASNEQKSGNRITRIGGRTAKDIGLGLIPDNVRDAIGRIGFLLSTDPDAANKFGNSEIMSDGARETIDAKREEQDELGIRKGAELTQETIDNILSKGQRTIFSKMQDSIKSAVSEKIEAFTNEDNAGDNAASAFQKVADKFDMDEEEAEGYGGQINDVVSGVVQGVKIHRMNKMSNEATNIHDNGLAQQKVANNADANGANAKKAVEAQNHTYSGVQSGMKFAKSGAIQAIVEHAISFLSSFASTGDIVDPTGLLDKLIAGGFTAITALINGIINYCTSVENVKDFIKIGDFNKQIDDLAKLPNSGVSGEKATSYKAMKEDEKKKIWMAMHGMDMSDAIDYVGKETVYALKFSVSKSCRLPYLRAMGMLVFATLGFTVAGGNVLADNHEVFDKLLGSR